MILAYLRGVLQPDYQFRNTSLIREHFLTLSLLRETDAAAYARMAAVESALLPRASETSFATLMRSVLNNLVKASALYKHQPGDVVRQLSLEDDSQRDISKMGAALHVLKTTDFAERMERTLAAEN